MDLNKFFSGVSFNALHAWRVAKPDQRGRYLRGEWHLIPRTTCTRPQVLFICGRHIRKSITRIVSKDSNLRYERISPDGSYVIYGPPFTDYTSWKKILSEAWSRRGNTFTSHRYDPGLSPGCCSLFDSVPNMGRLSPFTANVR